MDLPHRPGRSTSTPAEPQSTSNHLHRVDRWVWATQQYSHLASYLSILIEQTGWLQVIGMLEKGSSAASQEIQINHSSGSSGHIPSLTCIIYYYILWIPDSELTNL